MKGYALWYEMPDDRESDLPSRKKPIYTLDEYYHNANTKIYINI